MHRHEACQTSSPPDRAVAPVAARHPSGRVHLLRAAVASSLAVFVAEPAWALDDDVINVEAVASQRYDSNLFALPDGTDPPGGGSRSATTRTTGLTLHVDKAYGLQRFGLYGTVTHLHYNPYDYLDITSHTYGAHWAWTLTPSLTGNISIDESRSPNSFSDTGFETSPNPRTEENKRFDVNYRPGAALHPRFAITQSGDRSARTTIERQNAQTTSVESALVYEFHSSNTVEAYFRRGRGRYFDVTLDPSSDNDSQFNEQESGVSAHYDANGLSRFDGRVGYFKRKHEQFAQRDFGGTVASLGYTYTITGKTQIAFSAQRSVTASQTSISSYSRDESLSIQPIWYATGKITARASYSIANRDFRGSVTPGAEHLKFHTQDSSLTVDWDVLRALRLSASVVHTARSASDRTFQFSNRGALINGALHF